MLPCQSRRKARIIFQAQDCGWYPYPSALPPQLPDRLVTIFENSQVNALSASVYSAPQIRWVQHVQRRSSYAPAASLVRSGRLSYCTCPDLQPVSSSFSGLLPLSFPLEMPAGTDPAAYSAYCHFSYEELTGRCPRICWRYVYSTNSFCCQSSAETCGKQSWGTERGTGPPARLLRGAAAGICPWSPSPPSAEIGAFGLYILNSVFLVDRITWIDRLY